jgi:hypothetical protein
MARTHSCTSPGCQGTNTLCLLAVPQSVKACFGVFMVRVLWVLTYLLLRTPCSPRCSLNSLVRMRTKLQHTCHRQPVPGCHRGLACSMWGGTHPGCGCAQWRWQWSAAPARTRVTRQRAPDRFATL